MTERKAILVVGAGDATGGAIAKRFAREGYVACVARRKPLILRGRAPAGPRSAGGDPIVGSACRPLKARRRHPDWAGRMASGAPVACVSLALTRAEC